MSFAFVSNIVKQVSKSWESSFRCESEEIHPIKCQSLRDQRHCDLKVNYTMTELTNL